LFACIFKVKEIQIYPQKDAKVSSPCPPPDGDKGGGSCLFECFVRNMLPPNA